MVESDARRLLQPLQGNGVTANRLEPLVVVCFQNDNQWLGVAGTAGHAIAEFAAEHKTAPIGFFSIIFPLGPNYNGLSIFFG